MKDDGTFKLLAVIMMVATLFFMGCIVVNHNSKNQQTYVLKHNHDCRCEKCWKNRTWSECFNDWWHHEKPEKHPRYRYNENDFRRYRYDRQYREDDCWERRFRSDAYRQRL